MIRINLLGVAKPVAHAEGPSEGLAPEVMIIPGAIFAVLALIAGFIYWSWTADINRLTTNLAAQKREQTRLAGIMEQNKVYEQSLKQLQQRIDTIQTLQSSRVGPVALMHALGEVADRSNDLYLATMSTKAGRLTLVGEANSADAVANFVGALQRSGSFDDVQLRQSFQDDRGKRTSFKFNLDCIYKPSAPMAPPGPAAPHGGQPPAAARQAGM